MAKINPSLLKIKLKSVKEVSEFAENIFNTVREPLIALDKDLRVVKANQSFFNCFKVTPGETIGTLIYDLGNKQWDIPKLRELLETILPDKTTFDNFEVEHVFSTIGKRVMLLNARKINGGTGKEQLILLAIEDISERKLTEEAQANSETRYHGLFESARDGILILDSETGKIVDVNPVLINMLGYSKEQFINKSIWEIGVFKDIVLNRDNYLEFQRKGYNRFEHLPLETKDGRRIDIEFISHVNIAHQQKVTQCNIRDITEHKQLENSLKEQKEEFETIFNLVPAQIWYKDTHNNFIRVNRQVCIDIGMTSDKIEGHSAEELFPSFAEQYFKDDLEIINSRKPKFGITEQLNTANGDIRWVHTDKIPVFGSDGEINGLIAVIQDITKLILSEEALRNSEARLHTLVQTIPDLIWLKDIDGLYLSCNKMFERFFGAREADIVGKTDFDFVDGELAYSFRKNDNKAMAASKPTSNEEWITFADDGHRAFLETIKMPMYDAGGTLIGVLGIGRDITERKLAESKLTEKEFLLTQSQLLAHIGSWGWDLKGPIIWSDETYQVYGVLQENFKPTIESLINLIHPEDRSLMQRWLEACSAGESTDNLEFRIIHPDGSVHVINGSGGLIYDIGKKPIYMGGTVQDITENKRSEDKISMLAQSLKSINEIVSITDMEDKIIFVNESYLKTYGYNENELIGKHASLVMSPNNPINLAEEIFSATRLGGWKGEVWDVRKDGSEFPIYLSTSVVHDKNGKPLGLIGVAIDMTERKQFEKELIKAKDGAESANKLKDAFIANISHEIRTPLNGILGMTSLIRDILPGKIMKEDEELFTGIDISCQRIIRTVDMILNYSRLQVGEFPLYQKILDLSSLCINLVKQFIIAAKDKSLDLTFQNNCGDANIFADEYSITMAISNLIDNAIKYTDKGFVKVMLNKDGNENIILVIKDTGIGIDEDYLEIIFEPYRQEQMGYGRAYDGIGLGLSLVKKVLTLNNTNIFVESKKGEGTTFSINFGKAIKQPDKIAEQDIIAKIPSPQEKIINWVVLLVEDDITNQTTIKRFLGTQYTTLITDSSDKVLEILKKNNVDIILMDISINGSRNGLELTKKLKAAKEFCHIPVIAVTAHAFESDNQNALSAGCDGYLAKPFTKESLLNMITDYTSK
jgi:PAS domain S-box-containing protein